ncbi:MAG TPA: hypothetical protein VGM46_10555, partial [Mesorhizobium sp.]
SIAIMAISFLEICRARLDLYCEHSHRSLIATISTLPGGLLSRPVRLIHVLALSGSTIGSDAQ